MPLKHINKLSVGMTTIIILLAIACSKSGTIIETHPEPIAEVLEIIIETTTSIPSQLIIKAKGKATSAGWTKASLEIDDTNSHQDGIYEFNFVAIPPAKPSAAVLTPIEASYIFDPFPEDILGVRIKADQNELLKMLDTNITPTAYFEFSGSNETDRFVIKLLEASEIQHARDLLSGATMEQASVLGVIVKEQAIYNSDWSYHLDPDSIEFFDVAIEVCDSAMAYVEEHLDEVGGAFLPDNIWCPWGSQLTREVIITN